MKIIIFILVSVGIFALFGVISDRIGWNIPITEASKEFKKSGEKPIGFPFDEKPIARGAIIMPDGTPLLDMLEGQWTSMANLAIRLIFSLLIAYLVTKFLVK